MPSQIKIIAVQRITRHLQSKYNNCVSDTWIIDLNGIRTTARLRVRHKNKQTSAWDTVHVLVFENKAIRKHPEYKAIRSLTLLAIIDRYNQSNGKAVNEEQLEAPPYYVDAYNNSHMKNSQIPSIKDK